MRPILAIIKRLIVSNKVSFIITALTMLLATTSADSSIALSKGNYTWIIVIMTPFFFVFYDYTKLIYLGASKKDYYLGSIISYGILVLLVSIVNTGIHYLIDPLNHSQTVINMMKVCGWNENGIFIALLQQASFLFLTIIFLHMLLSMQFYWYGWLTDIILIGVICIFIPINSLRELLVGFFKLIMFNSNALMQIFVSLVLSIIFSLIGLIILKRKIL